MLEECGSRRMAQRAELDEGSEVDPKIETKRFEDEVFGLLQDLPVATKAPACKWTEPESKVLEKSEEDLKMIAPEEGAGGSLAMVGGLIALVAVGAGVAHQMGMLDGMF